MAFDYRVYFDVDGFEQISLPVNPNEITVAFPGNNSNYDVEGIGEIMTSVHPLSGLNLVIAKPLSGVPTGKCFAAADSSPVTYDDAFKESVLDALRGVDSPRETLERLISEGLLVNDLEAPAREMVPGIGELISALRSENAVFAAMSGSGSAVFGIFDTEEDAHRAYDSLSECERYKDLYGGSSLDCYRLSNKRTF